MPLPRALFVAGFAGDVKRLAEPCTLHPETWHAALHNLHCCHAANALQTGPIPYYLSINTDTPERPKSTAMNLIRNYRNWRRYRDTVNELSRLSNRELDDLGISRGEIPYVARKSV